jgi:FkbM family methyltransferase
MNVDDLFYRLSRSTLPRKILTPLVRSYLRYFPGSAGKETLWNRMVDPYLAWQSHPFLARTRFGRCLAGDTRDMIQQYIYYFGVWEPELTDWITERLRAGDTFIDVGANIGYYSLLASALVGASGSVTAVEASPAIFRQLQANLARNRVTNVRSVNVAASDRPGTVPLFRGPEHNRGETSLFPGEGYVPDGAVEAAPLSTILEPQEIAGARLIKIDVEGAEGVVLPGLIPLLSSGRPDLELIVELHPQFLTGPGKRAEDLVKLVCAAGFDASRLDNAYWPLTYLADRKPALPRPLRLPIQDETVVIFSPRDPCSQ